MIINILQTIDKLLWNGLLVYLLIALGILLTVKLKGMQFRYLFYSLKLAFSKHDSNAKGDISQFQSLMTALAATIGICSIAGMATAIVAGGFGAIFWMWVIALIGMVTKFSEALLAVKYRVVDKNNNMCGGPMYYLKKAFNTKLLPIMFSIFGALAALGGGNIIQSQSISDAIVNIFPVSTILIGIIITFIVGLIILGGIKTLGRVNSFLVPIMAILYVSGGIVIILYNFDQIPKVLVNIFTSAFSIKAAVGGSIGGGIMTAMQMGIARGISSNEAGLGSSPIASAAAKTDSPGPQALISMSGVFLSSFIVCTITVLVIGVTNVVGMHDVNGNLLNGAPLVMSAFEKVIPFGKYIVAVGIVLFGFSTILGWAYYGEKCVEYLFKERSIKYFRFLFLLVVFMGAQLHVDVVWALADIFNGLMALPNVIGMLFLSDIIVVESKIFFNQLRKDKIASIQN